jgi:heme/copper-type cytochrome/quinol oxidase subunit 2
MKDINTVQGVTTLPAHVEQSKALDQVKQVKRVCAYAMLAMLSVYIVRLMNSAGDIGVQQKNLILLASALTLLVVIPIIALNIYFVSRHRASNTTAKYSSRCSHSIRKEAVAWAIPIVIVAVLTFLGWGITHSLDLYKPIESKVAPERVATVAGA